MSVPTPGFAAGGQYFELASRPKQVYQARMANQLKWTRVQEVYGSKKEDTPTCSTYRAQVHGGWLVAIWSAPAATPQNLDTNKHTFAGGVTFVPDPTYAWLLDDHPTQ